MPNNLENNGAGKASHFFSRLKKTAGVSSGGLSGVGDARAEKVKIELINFSEKIFSRKVLKKFGTRKEYSKKSMIAWINLTGVHDAKLIAEAGEIFKLHALTLEDIRDTTQRPKVEEFDDYLFIVLETAYFSKAKNHVVVEQISLVLGQNFIITFQERDNEIFEPLRERIKQGKSRIRRKDCAYLAYSIIDLVVDHYFSVLERLGEKIGLLEEEVLRRADLSVLNKIYKAKQELIFIRKSIWPMRDVVNRLEKTEHRFFKDKVSRYLSDVYGHTIQIVETMETLRDMVSGMHDLYLSNQSNRMNQIMKVLTIFSTIFIPLTFITGVYGMNFDHMPELRTEYGYFVLWGIFIIVAAVMLYFFRKKKWL